MRRPFGLVWFIGLGMAAACAVLILALRERIGVPEPTRPTGLRRGSASPGGAVPRGARAPGWGWFHRPVPPPPDPRVEILAGLDRLLEAEAMQLQGALSAHVRLAEDLEAGYDPDRPVDAASLIKLAVMGALYDAWARGHLPRRAEDERRLRLMICRSRNIVTNELIDTLGMARVERWLVENGFEQTSLRTYILDPDAYDVNVTTAREMTRLMDLVARGQLVHPRASAEMRRLLLAQRWRDRIPARLPKGVRVGNKTGTMSNLIHDVAFVESPSGLRYSIAVLVERPYRPAVRGERLAALSRHVHDYLEAGWPLLRASRRTAAVD